MSIDDRTPFDDIVDTIVVTLNDPTVVVLVERHHLFDHCQPRRIIWTEEPSQITGPGNIGGTRTAPHVRSNQIYTLEYAVQAHVLAETKRNTFALATNLLAAVHEALGADAQPSRFVWETQREGAKVAGKTRRQDKIVITMTIAIRLDGKRTQLTPLEHFTLTQQLEQPIPG